MYVSYASKKPKMFFPWGTLVQTSDIRDDSYFFSVGTECVRDVYATEIESYFISFVELRLYHFVTSQANVVKCIKDNIN